MYGTVARAIVKQGHEDQLVQMLHSWNEERRPAVDGAIASYIFRLDSSPNEFMLVAVFRDQESYRKNAEDPEQDRWYRQLRAHLESDPEWHDGEVVGS